MFNRKAILAAALALIGAVPGASAQDYPTVGRPVRLISPYPAGGSNDITTRLIAQKLAERWGRQVIAENRVGAQNRLASEQVAKSPPDGYTLLMVAAPHGVNPALYEALPYDTLRDFAAIVWVVSGPVGFWVNASAPWKTMQELVAHAKSHPGKLNVGSPGNASAPHLVLELFKQTSSVDALHVPMKGDAPLVTELLGGRLDVAVTGLAAIRSHWTSGKVRVLAMAHAQRAPGLENVPTLAESGFAGVEGFAWFGLVAPAGTPAAVVTLVNRDVNAILAAPDVRQRLDALGLIPAGGTPQAFHAHIASEITKWTKVAKTAGIKAD
jgi:tripartite-type tricarboxylate transporter receptor subunit TctC